MVLANVFPKLKTVKNFVIPLCKKRRFRTRLDSRHVKVSRILAESIWECLYHDFSSIWGKLILKISPLGLREISGVPMWSILFNISGICNSQRKRNCLEKEKLFLNFSFHFWNRRHILNILNKKMIVLANMFLKLETAKNFVAPICKKRRFGTRLDSQHVKVSRILAKSPWECFYHVFSSI